MGTEEFRVLTSGPIVSFFLYETVNRPTDFEGLLFGDYQRSLHREISDHADAGDQNRPATIIHDVYIRRILPTGARFSFYNRRYEAEMPEYAADMVKSMNSIDQTPTPSNRSLVPPPGFENTTNRHHFPISSSDDSTVRSGFLGWFRFQRVPPSHPSSETAICRLLSTSEALRSFPPLKDTQPLVDTGFDVSSYYPWSGNGCFFLFAYPSDKNDILEWNMCLKAFNTSAGHLRPVRMNIRNLGDTTHTDYWKLGEGGIAADMGVDRLFPGLVSLDLSKQYVADADRMAEMAKNKLQEAFRKTIATTQTMLHRYRQSQTIAPAHLSMRPSSYYIKYGYAPSASDSKVLLDRLTSAIGSGSQARNDDGGGAAGTVDVVMSQGSPDLFDTPPAYESIATGHNSSHDDRIETVEDDWQGPPQSHTNFISKQRGSKRPKTNTSSSSSGAASDEMPENGTTAVTPKIDNVRSLANTRTTRLNNNGQQQGGPSRRVGNNTPKTSGQQQLRKKSKSSDDSGSSGGDLAASPNLVGHGSSLAPTAITQQRPSRKASPNTRSNSSSSRASPVSGLPPRVPAPAKGRGQRFSQDDVPKPPGFEN